MSDHSHTSTMSTEREPSFAAVCAAGFVALAVAMGIGRFAFTPVLPLMIQAGSADVASGGWLAAANYAGYLAGALSARSGAARAATAHDRRAGRRRAVDHGDGLDRVAAGSGRCCASQPAWRAPGCSSAPACGASAGSPASDVQPVQACSMPESAPASPSPGSGAGTPVRRRVAPERLWLQLGAFAVAGIVLVVARDAAPARDIGKQTANLKRRTSSKRDDMGLVVCYGLLGFGYILPATFLPVLARAVVADPALFGLAWPVFGAAAAASTLLAGVVLAPFARRRVLAGSHLLMAVGCLLPVLHLSPLDGAGGSLAGRQHLHGGDDGRHAGGPCRDRGRSDTGARPADRGLRDRADRRADAVVVAEHRFRKASAA